MSEEVARHSRPLPIEPIHITVPTLGRRPIERLLSLLSAQARDLGSTRITLLHNALEADEFLIELSERFACNYMLVTELGFSNIRNAALDSTPRGHRLLFIDDDELPVPGWLRHHAEAAATWDADITLGPVDAVIPTARPRWADEGRTLRRRIRLPSGPYGGNVYSGNTSVRIDFVRTHSARFDPRYNSFGGEDTAFFDKCRQHGALIVWANEALAFETPDPARITIRYLLRRSYADAKRNTLYRLLTGDTSRAALLARKCLQLAYALGLLTMGALRTSTPRMTMAARHGAAALGCLAGALTPAATRDQQSPRMSRLRR